MTGGTTGGHVNPAIAIANYIKEKEPNSEIAFVGTSKGIENKLVPKAGYELYHVEIQGLRRKLTLENIKTAWLTLTSVKKAEKLIKTFKPDLVIGTGGYVCWPVVRAAAKLKIPAFLHESNAVPGVAVKMLEKYAKIVFTNFEVTKDFLKYKEKAVRVGNPLIGDFAVLDKTDCRKKLGIEGKYRHFILSCGGSMGAEKINEAVIDFMKTYTSKHPEILHIHASGAIEYEAAKKRFDENGLAGRGNCVLAEYIYDMPEKMTAADVVINRAGAMTLSELALKKKPCVLIPSPNVTNNHQFKNAKVLSDAGAAILIEESELSKERLESEIDKLFKDKELQRTMGENIGKFACPEACELIYSKIKALVNE